MLDPGPGAHTQQLSMSADSEVAAASQSSNIQAAIARTLTRSMALYFARPVRLFRPAKVNGWLTLKSLATQQGTTLTSQYLLSLVKLQGFWIIPKHFVPPMIVNAFLGTILWGVYGEASSRLEPYLDNRMLLNAVAGGMAGASQAIVAAPAENVRILLEHGFGGHSWSCAWKEVFREKVITVNSSASNQLQDVRQLRSWLQEVGQLAGRGWNGWGWTCGKDACGFAAFFSIFEVSRRAGSAIRGISQEWISTSNTSNALVKQQLPPVINGVVLVTGGVVAGLAYEFICRPWDVARRVIHLERLQSPNRESVFRLLTRKVTADGVHSFFRSVALSHYPQEKRTRWNLILRTAGRVGPWGVGFLVWEACGPGLL
ncbi:hypothetical protein B0H34DRAFT_311174 [Crassisporium funariophilum]|nr:hypothetical protein B0H34DRAFT_311174 [Crassisporium funariophilum]